MARIASRAWAVGNIGISRDLQMSFAMETHMTGDFTELARRFEAGEVDLAAAGRGLTMEPDWVAKARDGGVFAPFRLAAYGSLGLS